MLNKSDTYSQLKRLAIFATVVELGSFSQAAKRLGMNRSGVSEQVAALEAFFDTRLLHRTTRRLSLTTDGQLVLPEAMHIKQSLDKILERFDDQKVAGRIRVTTTHDFASHWLTPRLISFREAHPEINFDLVLSDDPINLIKDQIDLAFRIGVSSPDSSLIARPLFRERLRLFVSPDFYQNYQDTDLLNQLNQMPWILLNQLAQNDQIQLISENNNINFSLKPRHFHRVDSPIVMIHQIKAGMGIGLGFQSLVQNDLDEGSLIQILPEWSSVEMVFSMLYPSRKHLPLRVRTFMDFLIDDLQDGKNA